MKIDTVPVQDRHTESNDLAGARAAFDAWWAALSSSRSFTPRTIANYEQIWTPWPRFLAGRRKHLDEANAEDFCAFLDGLQVERA